MGMKSYAKGVVKEGKRVRWPKREELIPAIVVTVVISVVAALILLAEDAAGSRLIEILSEAFKSISGGTGA
ncbi:MAG TPA: preprotein translocase subunit SecE [Bacilli bacterium]|nr:preprotein translocase subunit SecE [Bacilli bacterium]